MTEPAVSPCILVGMHRSGTTLLTRLLAQLGVHMGADSTRETSESVFFRRRNYRLLRENGANWIQIDNWLLALQEAAVCERAIKACRNQQFSRWQWQFLGVHGWLRGQRLSHMSVPWGWKDPRNTLTLPIWREVYPEARIIHVVRNGLDVAHSLLNRETALRQNLLRRCKRNILMMLPGRSERVTGQDFPDLEAGFRLWERYLDVAAAHLAEVPDRLKLEFRYEDLLAKPRETLQQLTRFLGLPAPSSRIELVSGSINSIRRFACVGNQLSALEQELTRRPWMIHYYSSEFRHENLGQQAAA